MMLKVISFVLHYIFLPRINRVPKILLNFGTNIQKTEKNWSTEQIWTNRMIGFQNRQYLHIADIHDFEIDA